MDFQVGDEIVMKKGAPYTFTREGSIGIIKEVFSNSILVEFSLCTGNRDMSGESFEVFKECAIVTSKCDPNQIIINKIRLLDKRFKERGVHV
jgi:hypothetical protein